MSVLDKFLNVIKLNDDEEFDEEEFYDEEEEVRDDLTGAGGRMIRKTKDDAEDSYFTDRKSSGYDADDDDDVSFTDTKTVKRTASGRNKVAPIRKNRRADSGGMKVCVIRPHSMEDAREITDSLLTDCTVLLNLEGLELELAQRIIDFTAGSCYAIDGNLQKVSTYIFVITPASVYLTGDFQEILSDAFDVPF